MNINQNKIKMKTGFLKLYNASIVGLLATLGFMTCVNAGCAEYGVPCVEGKNTIIGNVSSKETLQPIKGINVHAECSSSQTNEQGIYQVKVHSLGYLYFHDPTGNYHNLDTLIEFQANEMSKIVDIQLTPKENNPPIIEQ